MTQLSPTALEAAELAVHRCRTGLPNIVATTAITAYLAQREKEGWVMVPKIILDTQATSTTPVLAEFIDARSSAERG